MATKTQKTVGGLIFLACAPREGKCRSTARFEEPCSAKTRLIVVMPCSDVDDGEPGLGAVRICPACLEVCLPRLCQEEGA